MTNSELLNYIPKVFDFIREGMDDGSALCKCASEHNMAPAQLERMVHLFNAVKSNATMEKNASDRGRTFSYTDPSVVINDYTSYKTNNSTNSYKQPNLVPRNFIVSDVFTEVYTLPTIKEASEADKPTVTKEACLELRDSLSSLKEDVIYAVNKSANELSRTFKTNTDKWENYITDIYTRHGDRGDFVVDYITNELKEIGHDYINPSLHKVARSLVRDSLGIMGKIDEVLDAYDTYLSVMAAEDKNNANLDMILKKEAATSEKVEVEEKYADPLNDFRRKKYKTPEELKYPYEYIDIKPDPRLKPEPPQDNKSKTRPSPAITASVGKELLQNIDPITMISNAQTSAVGAVKGVHGITQSLIDTTKPTWNRRQEKLDESIQSARQFGTLQQLLLSDPDIKQHDPEKVQRYFDIIRTISPNVAADPLVAGSFLKEALQYDTIPKDTVKLLMELENLGLKNTETTSKIRSNRYLL